MSAKPRLSSSSSTGSRVNGLNKSQISNSSFNDDDDELDRSLQELERRHDHLLLGGHGKQSAVLLDFTTKLQVENDQLKIALERQQAESAQQQMQWEEEKVAMEKRREKSKKAFNQELEQASIIMNQEVEKCSQIVQELRVGLSAKHEQEIRKLKQEYQDAKTSYEARISALDKSLWEMRTRLTESETKRAGESLEHKMQKEKWESEQIKLQNASTAELEHAVEQAKLAWEAEKLAEWVLKESSLQEQHKLALQQAEEELTSTQAALQEALKQTSAAAAVSEIIEEEKESATGQELAIQATTAIPQQQHVVVKPAKPWKLCLFVFGICTLLLFGWLVEEGLANSSSAIGSESIDLLQQFIRSAWCKLLGWQTAPIS